MKELMLGNKAAARGLFEAGVSFVSSYPGTPSTEITEEAAKYDEIYCEWAPNEKVAMEAAFGASLSGVRSFCGMKHVGLNVAADPLYTMSYTGVNAGLVVGVADDAGMHSSQNEQDSRRHAIGAKVPMLEPSDSAEALEFAKLAYELSEEYDTPVLLKMCTRVAHSQSLVDTSERKVVEKTYEKNPAKYSMAPANAIRRHPFVEERMRKLAEYGETSGINRVEKVDGAKRGFITSSTSYQYVKEVFGSDSSILKLGMVNPLPDKLLIDFAKSVEEVYVVEELDPVIEDHCKALGLAIHGKDVLPICGEFSQGLLRECILGEKAEYPEFGETTPVRPPVMCAGCPHRGLFYSLKKLNCTVLGDIGCYTLGGTPPLGMMDMTLCMGASVSAIHGFNRAIELKKKKETSPDGEVLKSLKAATGSPDARSGAVVAVIGDSTFMHSGMTGLANIAYNMTNSTVIIVDNSITGMTGHQQNPTTGYNIKGDPAGKIDLEALCHALGFERVSVVDPYDLSQCEKVIGEELGVDAPSVIISRRPCALLKYVKHNPPLCVDSEKCKSCKSCMRIGCPAISMKADGTGTVKAVIDKTQCTGCGICKQMCAFSAIS